MGLSSDLIRQNEVLDQETVDYLSKRPKLNDAIIELVLSLRKINREHKDIPAGQRKVKALVKNYNGSELVINVIGINSNSLVSSEIEGHIGFTFIQDLCEIKKIDNKLFNKENLKLIKSC